MKKFLIAVLAFVTATSVFALPPPKTPRREYGGGPKIVFRNDITHPRERTYKPTYPSKDVANAVAITGIVATTLDALGRLMEYSNPPQPTIIVLPEGTEGPIIVREQEPVVKHPVPISTQSIMLITP